RSRPRRRTKPRLRPSFRANAPSKQQWPNSLRGTHGPRVLRESFGAVVTPRTLLIKQLQLMFKPVESIQITLLAVVTLAPAGSPSTTFWKPVVLFDNAPKPTAVFCVPVVLPLSMVKPTAVSPLPVVLLIRA